MLESRRPDFNSIHPSRSNFEKAIQEDELLADYIATTAKATKPNTKSRLFIDMIFPFLRLVIVPQRRRNIDSSSRVTWPEPRTWRPPRCRRA